MAPSDTADYFRRFSEGAEPIGCDLADPVTESPARPHDPADPACSSTRGTSRSRLTYARSVSQPADCAIVILKPAALTPLAL